MYRIQVRHIPIANQPGAWHPTIKRPRAPCTLVVIGINSSACQAQSDLCSWMYPPPTSKPLFTAAHLLICCTIHIPLTISPMAQSPVLMTSTPCPLPLACVSANHCWSLKFWLPTCTSSKGALRHPRRALAVEPPTPNKWTI
jgi:hypothetical protein